MIKIDYVINRNEGDKFTEYRPDQIPTELPILSYIQGPNSSGKSTLLNLIALAFHGLTLNNEELNPDLRERVDALINSSHQKVQFNIEVENELLGVKFISQKKEFDTTSFQLRRNDKPISADAFKRDYKLIYDIPNNPLGRLPNLLYTLKDQQKDIGSDIAKLREKIRAIIKEIQAGKDPDLLKGLKKKYRENVSAYESNHEIEIDLEERFKNIQEYSYARFYTFYLNQKEDASARLNELTKHEKKEKRNQNQNYRTYLNHHRHLDERIEEIGNLIETIKSVLPKLIDKGVKPNYQLWKNADLRNEITHPGIYNDIITKSQYLSKYLRDKNELERNKYAQDLEKENLLKNLVAVLIDYQDKKITIPSVNLTISDFITTLINNIKELQESTLQIKNTENYAQSLDQLVELMRDAIGTAAKVTKADKNFGIEELDDFAHQQEREELEKWIKGYDEKLNELRKNSIKVGINPDELVDRYAELSIDKVLQFYESYNETQILEKLEDTRKKYIEKANANRKLEKRIEDEKGEIERLESKEPHKYQEKFGTIQLILGHVQHLEARFDTYDGLLSRIVQNPENKKQLTEEEQTYSKHIGGYLAKKIGKIKHIKEIYQVINIDVPNKTILTQKGTEIHFSDLGTGQGQAAYLETLLSMNENKKIIALFDEVAMMDEKSLKPIMEKLKSLYHEKKLLMAIIVQKADNVHVEEML